MGRYLTPDPLNLGQIQIDGESALSDLTIFSETSIDTQGLLLTGLYDKIAGFIVSYMLYDFELSNPENSGLYAYAINDPINQLDPKGLKNWHFDYTKEGERLIHSGKYRFNKYGDLVTHRGKKIEKVPRQARRVLKWLRGVKPDFFRTLVIMFDFQIYMAIDPTIDPFAPLDPCTGKPKT